MVKINLEHFLVTNVAGGPNTANGASADAIPFGGLKNVRHFIYEKPATEAIFFGFIIFPTAFTAIGLLEKLLEELKQAFDAEPAFDEIAFEKLVGFFNNKLGSYTSAHKNQKDLARFDICLGAAIGAKLIFAPLGNVSAVLFVPEAGHSRYYNLIKDARGAKVADELLKLKEIIAGNLTKNNSIVIANSELLDTYSFGDLEKLAANVRARAAATNIQSALRRQKTTGTFTGFILETLEAPPAASLGSASSLERLFSKRKETEKIMRAASPINIKRTGEKAKNISVRMAGGVKKILYKLWLGLKPLLYLILLFLIALTNWNNRGQANWEAIAEFIKLRKNAFAAYLRGMTLFKKIIISLVIILIGAFSVSMVMTIFKNKSLAAEQRFSAAMEKISNLRTDAEAVFIQANDQAKARQLLEDALNESESITPANPAQRAALNDVHDQIQNRLFALWKLQVVVLPQPLAALAKILPDEKLVNAFSPDGKQIIAWSAKKISLVADNKLVESFDTDSELKGQFDFDNGIVTIKTGDSTKLAQFSPAEHNLYTASIADWQGNLINFVIQNDKLYALAHENLFITKHAKSLTGFAPGAGWLKEPIDVKDAVSLTIDGNLYTISGTGEIKKMYDGRLAPFTAEHPEPKLTATNKIWTSENTKYIFTANLADARLVIFDKKGDVVVQLKFNNLAALKDFYVNDTTKIPSVSLFDGANLFYLNLAPYF